MVEIPREVIIAAAKASSRHFETCDFGDKWESCPDCCRAYDRAHYAVHAAAEAIRADPEIKQLRDTVARAYAFAEEMRFYCSPHGVAADYANRLEARLRGETTNG